MLIDMTDAYELFLFIFQVVVTFVVNLICVRRLTLAGAKLLHSNPYIYCFERVVCYSHVLYVFSVQSRSCLARPPLLLLLLLLRWGFFTCSRLTSFLLLLLRFHTRSVHISVCVCVCCLISVAVVICFFVCIV